MSLASFIERYLPSTPMVEYFSTRRSFYHAFHSASKLVFSLSMILVTVYLKSALLIALMPLTALLVMLSARLPLRTVMSWSLTPFLFAVALCVLLPLIGYPLLDAFLILVKAVVAAWFMFLLVLTTPMTHLARLASKFLPSWLADTFVLASRYFFLIFDEAQRMVKAMNSRGNPPLKRKVTLVANVMASLFLKGYERAERVYVAMTSRGYRGKIPLTSPERFRLRDALFVAASLAFSLVMVYVEVLVF
ncbi:MAG: energy-coupling factor transporter transmembrane component T [Candidatus Jordarchaeales archaeon]